MHSTVQNRAGKKTGFHAVPPRDVGADRRSSDSGIRTSFRSAGKQMTLSGITSLLSNCTEAILNRRTQGALLLQLSVGASRADLPRITSRVARAFN